MNRPLRTLSGESPRVGAMNRPLRTLSGGSPRVGAMNRPLRTLSVAHHIRPEQLRLKHGFASKTRLTCGRVSSYATITLSGYLVLAQVQTYDGTERKRRTTMPKNTQVSWRILFFLILITSGCELATTRRATRTVQPTRTLPLPTVIDRGLLYGEPCDPPCWEGITPGHSSEEDVVRVLEQLKTEGRIERYTKMSDTDYLVTWSFFDMHIALEGKFVDYMWINYNHLLGFDYRVKQLIKRLGEPEAYLLPFNLERNNCLCENWDDSRVYAIPSTGGYLLYPSQGVTVFIEIPHHYEGCVCPEMKTSTFYVSTQPTLPQVTGRV